MKLIAFYLPQFHRIKENDQWWGEGYTEWTAVRRARPLFRGHYQPREPYADNYYDLADVAAAHWQQDLAKEYGVHGFCYYHYWFMGRRLLEKPFELVLATPDLTLPFCLSWANQPWTRTWYDQAADVLMPQEYGGPADWKQHFDCLLRAFQDQRYIRVDDKPLFVIHDSRHIPECGAMLDYWNDLAIQGGLKGIYFVQTLGGFLPDRRQLPFEAQLHFEPGYTMVNDQPWWAQGWRRIVGTIRLGLRRLGFPDRRVRALWNYDNVYRAITRRVCGNGQRVFLGAFTDWDNSPRRHYSAAVFRGATPYKFERYLARQLVRASSHSSDDFVFVNAWNEWGEGAYLEPDKRYGTAYLEAVQNALKRVG